MNFDLKRSSAREAGYLDYKLGINENPFPILTQNWQDWDDGWLDAEAEQWEK